jgi:polyhydroxyalkanoate synthesis regulator phasin
MKSDRATTSLNLPTLLSFNELAWVAVSAMALFCGYLLSETSDHSTSKLQQQLAAGHRGLAAQRASSQELSNRLAQATSELAEAARRQAQAERRIAELVSQMTQAQTEMLSLTSRLSHVEEEASKLKNRLAEAQSKHASATDLNARLQAQLQQVTDRLEVQKKELAEARRELWEAANELAAVRARLAERPSEGNVRKELLGLRGAMSNVVILLDRSSSMADGRRWGDSLRVIEAWLEYLPIESCALITFSSQCEAFPPGGHFLAVGGTNEIARTARKDLIRQVRARPPDGNTATVEALQLAYSYPGVDTIILFTDGEPLDLRRATDPKRGLMAARESELSAAERKRIAKAQIAEALALARKHPDIPINVVALADYFTDWKSEFLLGLARNTGGAFLGR